MASLSLLAAIVLNATQALTSLHCCRDALLAPFQLFDHQNPQHPLLSEGLLFVQLLHNLYLSIGLFCPACKTCSGCCH